MTRSGKILGSASLLALAPAAVPAPAAEDPELQTRKQLREVIRQLRDLRADVAGLRDDLLTTTTSAQRARADLRELQDRFRHLEEFVLQQQAEAARRLSVPPALPPSESQRLEERVRDLEQAVRRFSVPPDLPRSDVQRLEEPLHALEQAFRRGEAVTARRFSVAPEAGRPATIRLQNRSAVGATFIVDDVPHYVPPF